MITGNIVTNLNDKNYNLFLYDNDNKNWVGFKSSILMTSAIGRKFIIENGKKKMKSTIVDGVRMYYLI